MTAARRRDGATAVEYAILASLIAAVIVFAVFAVGLVTRGFFLKLGPF